MCLAMYICEYLYSAVDQMDIHPAVDSPQIIQHPTTKLDMVVGSTVKFTVTATGGGTLMYKWQRDGADLNPLPEEVSGETTSTLQIDSVKKQHKGTYTCIVSNAAGTTRSKPAQLTVSKFLYLTFLIPSFENFEDRFVLTNIWNRGRWAGLYMRCHAHDGCLGWLWPL